MSSTTTTLQRREEEVISVGRSVPGIDAISRVTGATKFVYDLEMPRMLHARVRRCPHPYAKIVRLDTTKAEGLPGVKAIVTGKDFGPKFGSGIKDTPVMAVDVCRFAGEAVAAVAATDKETAERALDLIEVEYEPLPAVYNAEDAMKRDQKVVLHPELNSYERAKVITPFMDLTLPNVAYHIKVRNGDVEEGFRKADRIIENKFTTQRVHAIPLEPHVAIAYSEDTGMVTVVSSTQSPMRIRNDLVQVFRLPPSKVRVIGGTTSGGYGNKLTGHIEAICVALALRTKRPVRLFTSREETFIGTTVKHPFIICIKDGVMDDGTIVARQMKSILDGGAYCGGAGVWVARNSVFAVVSEYKLHNLEYDAYRAYTNHTPGGPFRGFGSPQVVWAIESQMDIIARELGLDPVELREKNLLEVGERSAIGELVYEENVMPCVTAVKARLGWGSGYQRSDGDWRIGRGIAIANKHSTAPGASAAYVRIREDESIEVKTGASENGQGAYTILAQIAAQEFNAPVEKVRVSGADTDLAPADEGAFGSRQTYNSGNAVILACRNAKKELFRVAAKRLGIDAADLAISDGRIYSKVDGSVAIRVKDLFLPLKWVNIADEVGEFAGKATWFQQGADFDPKTGRISGDLISPFYTASAQAAEVAVNILTGEVRIRRMVCAVDAGKAINPAMVEGQIEGGVAMAISGTLFEEVVHNEGIPVNPTLADYVLPTTAEMPAIETIIVEMPHRSGPFGARGVGEAPMLATAPAIGNAIFDAIEVRVKDLPITPERILRGLGKIS